jgi:hypothetical protein
MNKSKEEIVKQRIIVLLVLGFLLLGSQYLNAQQPLINGCSEAGMLNQPIRFNCDYSGGTGNGVILHYRGQADVSFSLLSMNPISEDPFYQFTYESIISFANSPGILEYFYSASQDTIMTTQSPKNENNQFPPSSFKYAHFLADPQGDMAGGSAGSWLDLTDFGMTYSDSRLYCYLGNVSGTWPLSQFLNYFAYTYGFLITSGTDSSYYALVYANIPLLLSTGLYRLNRTDTSYTQIGNINTSISGGILHMACDISAFTSDPAWPGWPPPDGYIIPMGATLTAGLSGQFANDYTYPAIYQPQTQYLNFALNNPPELSSYQIVMDSAVSITSRIRYFDQDNNLPDLRRFLFDSNSFDMRSFDHVYSDSSEFEATIPWPSGGWHRFYFEFSDGLDTAVTAIDSLLIMSGGCSYQIGDINGNGQTNGIDVTYGVSFFKGGNPPPISCPTCPETNPFYAAGDVNGNCVFNGIDITYFVSYLKGGAALRSCPDCPPVGLTTLSLPEVKADTKSILDKKTKK